MPLSNFHDLFMSWSDNCALDLKSLRLKAVTLLALTALLRPSDIASNARYIDDQGVECRCFLCRQGTVFGPGCKNLVFWYKTMTPSVQGWKFKFRDAVMQTLQDYTAHTESQRPADRAVLLLGLHTKL